MMTRQTCRAGNLTDGVYVVRRVERADTVQHMVKVHTFAGRTAMIRADGYVESTSADVEVELATEAEITEYKREQDRFAVCRALTELGRRIADEALPVPVGGRGIVVSFDLADDSDLEPWSQWLSKRPQRGTSRPVIQAEAEGVEVYVYGPGTSGEFGPDLADVAQEQPDVLAQNMAILRDHSLCAPDVEHGDSVGAFPVVARPDAIGVWRPCRECRVIQVVSPIEVCGECESDECAMQSADEMRAEEDEPARSGWAPPSGHAAVLPPDALKHDGRYDGENES